MGSQRKEELEQRALGSMVQDAFFTWPSAVTIAFFLMMFLLNIQLFPGWQSWFWLAFGGIAEAIYLWATITDPVAAQQAVSRMLEERYTPGDIRNTVARQRLQKALDYKRNIDAYVARQTGAMKESLSQTSAEINELIGMIYRLGKNIDSFETNEINNRDLRQIPTDLANLRKRAKMESDPDVLAELTEAIRIREEHLQYLEDVANTAKRTEIKMDNAVAQLSTIYTQMQVLSSRELDSSSTQRIRDNVRESVQELSDMIDAMDEVYRREPADASRLSDDSLINDGTTMAEQQQARRSNRQS